MNLNKELPVPSAPRGFRRVAPAFSLFFMSPFVAEFLLGNIAIDAFWLILFFSLLYGGGALVVRETVRRLGLGWPAMLLLALAYGLLEEGIVLQTLFNPNYLGLHLLQQGHVPVLGMGAWWTSYVLTLHSVWSITVPILIVEALFEERRTQPWLGRIGFGVAFVLFILGGLILHAGTRKQDPFSASGLQLVWTWVVMGILVLAALRSPQKAGLASGAVPRAWIMGILSMGWGLVFMKAPYLVKDWPLAGVQWSLDLIACVLIMVLARRSAWTSLHTVAAAGGAMLAYACHAFGQDPVAGSKGVVAHIGNTLFAGIAIVFLILALRKARASVAVLPPA